MKAVLLRRFALCLLALTMLASGASCTTSHDHSGRPVQRVDPGKVAIGLLIAGVAAYAIANADDRHDRHDCHDHYYCDCY